VLLKQPGLPVPYVVMIGVLRLAPCVWQSAQAAAFNPAASSTVSVWVGAGYVLQGIGEWGAPTGTPFVTWQGPVALLAVKQLTPAMLPVKSVP
jgi:hypothetical protein